ncbi:DUF294 nucleotidyltransferase-like domain-containing protein [Cobetia marina]|uniref:DUF294 nucleotidyltransferase-like domain-containing protein n=1 Tax=Cobetia marina TaxID=28258 RepID=UPI0008652F8E|nr:DUF294 nucleotidyltransferase-like domain-containing protein [Cobetia marina]AOM00396.1 cyclic nucleotide-binding protein [Cobetia marina]
MQATLVEIPFGEPPFSLLDERSRARLAENVDLQYFAALEQPLIPGAVGEALFIIHKGEVVELAAETPLPDTATLEQARREGHDAWLSLRIGHYSKGDLFGALTLLNGECRTRFVCEQETLCYQLPADHFRQLCEGNPGFEEYFQHSLRDKARLLAAYRDTRLGSSRDQTGFMLARVMDCMRPPLVMPASSSIEAGVKAMGEAGADSLIIEVQGRCGVVTRTDLLNALVLEGLPATHRLAPLGTFALVAVTAEDYLFQALVQMTRHRVARVVVQESLAADAKVVGVIELTDVLGFFSNRSQLVSLEIERAADLEALALASARLPELVRALVLQGAHLRHAMALLSALNGRLIERTFALLVEEQHRVSCCLMLMGSEGRGEQMLKTDQDNGLILADGHQWPDCSDAMQTFSATLARLGYPPCPGNIMVSNPEWVATESRWRGKVARWCAGRDGEALMNLAIVFDARASGGNAELVDSLRGHLVQHARRDELLLSHFARPALRFSTPLTLFGSLRSPRHGIDIKKGGIFPIVHGVRTMALERGVMATGTFARLEALVEEGRIEASDSEDLSEALSLFSELRLRQQLRHLEEAPANAGRHAEQELSEARGDASTASANLIITQSLSSLERDLLRDALSRVKDFKQRLTHRYHLDY